MAVFEGLFFTAGSRLIMGVSIKLCITCSLFDTPLYFLLGSATARVAVIQFLMAVLRNGNPYVTAVSLPSVF
ncbi:hypothetical protein F240042I4_29690 [Eisenbergiella tayi]